MGGKQRRGWKHLQVLVATVMAVFFLQGCFPSVKIKKRTGMVAEKAEPEKKLRWVAMMKNGSYEQFLRDAKDLLKDREDTEMRQKALYYMALTYLHPDNPLKDMKKAEFYFRKLIRLYPDGLYAEESKVWLGLISIIEKSKKIDIEIEKKKQEFSR